VQNGGRKDRRLFQFTSVQRAFIEIADADYPENKTYVSQIELQLGNTSDPL
jgi:hypothetical protein